MDSDNFLFVDVTKDLELCGKMLEKINTLFMKCILLELLTDRNDPTNENKNLVFPLIRALIGLFIEIDHSWYFSCLNDDEVYLKIYMFMLIYLLTKCQ